MIRAIRSLPMRCLVFLSAALVVSGVGAQSATETMLRMSADPGEFYLFDQTDVQIMDYKTERDVRLCVDRRRHAVPLKVDYDGKTATVRVGDCFMFEAKRVVISPADDLAGGWDLSGTVETEQR